MKHKLTFILISIFSMAILWSLFSYGMENEITVPSLGVILKAFVHLIIQTKTWLVLGSTMVRIIIVLLISFVMGIILGFLSFMYPKLEVVLKPYVSLLRTLPVISVIVLFWIIFSRVQAVYLIAFFMIFPVIYEGVLGALQGMDQTYLYIYKVYSNHKGQAFKTFIPMIHQPLFTVLLQSFGLSVKVMVMAEYLMQVKSSIGMNIYEGFINIEYDRIFAWTLYIVMIVYLVEIMIKYVHNKISQNT